MALFYDRKRARRSIRTDNSRPQHRGLPEFMKHLNVRCQPKNSHELAVRMAFLAEALTDKGWPMAIYYCPMDGCNWREGWVIDWDTGKPRRLFGRPHNR